MTDEPAVDWRYWRHMLEVKQWEACALSLNIDPDRMQASPNAWMAGPGNGPAFLRGSFPSESVKIEFEKRVRLLGACLFKSEHFRTVNNLVIGGRHLATVSLREFAAWGESVELEMPPELVAMAGKTPAHATPQAQTSPAEALPVYPTIKKEGFLLKRAALVRKYKNSWPEIVSDLNHANENGLSSAAKGTAHGDWFESAALMWAEQRGKFTAKETGIGANSVFNLSGTKHTLKG